MAVTMRSSSMKGTRNMRTFTVIQNSGCASSSFCTCAAQRLCGSGPMEGRTPHQALGPTLLLSPAQVDAVLHCIQHLYMSDSHGAICVWCGHMQDIGRARESLF